MDDEVIMQPCPDFSRQELTLSDFLLTDKRPEVKPRTSILNNSNNNISLTEARSQRISAPILSITQTEFEFMFRKKNKLIYSRVDFFLNKSSGCITSVQLFNREIEKITENFGCNQTENNNSVMKSMYLDESTLIEKVTVISGINAINRIDFDLKKMFKLVTLNIGEGKDHKTREEKAPLDNQRVSGFFGSFNSNEQLNTFRLILEGI